MRLAVLQQFSERAVNLFREHKKYQP